MRVPIEREGARIRASVPYALNESAKAVPGARPIWSRSRNGRRSFEGWSYPLDLGTCRALRSVFGERLDIGPLLRDWAWAERQREASLDRLAGTPLDTTVDLESVWSVAPDAAAAMEARGYQTVAARFGAVARRYILADAPGLGKCLETFGALLEGGVRRGHILVICPRTAMRAAWERDIQKWLPRKVATVHVAQGDRAERETIMDEYFRLPVDRMRFLVINAEMVRWRKESINKTTGEVTPEAIEYPILFDIRWDAIIGDEVHKYLMNANPRAKKTSAVGFGFQRLEVRDDGIKAALSGTPMKGKPKNLWGTLHWIQPKTYTSEWNWVGKYFKSEFNKFAHTKKTYTDELLPGAEERLAAELRPLMMRRTKDELHRINPAWAPPPKEYFEVWVDLSPEQKAAYETVVNDAMITFEDHVMNVNGVLAEMTRLKQFAGASARIVQHPTKRLKSGRLRPAYREFVPTLPSGKLDWLMDTFLPKRGITGDPKTETGDAKVVLASQFTSLINLFAPELRRNGIDCYTLTGETSDRERDRIVQDFQNNPHSPRVFFINTEAGGVALTLDAADDVVILDETWVPDEQEQVEDRAHRTSRPDHNVSIWYVRSRDTLEYDIAFANESKDTTQKNILDAQRGVEWAKRKLGAKVKP